MGLGDNPTSSRGEPPVTNLMAEPVVAVSRARSEGATDVDQADQELLSALRRGDAGAFERLVRMYGGRMLAVTLRLLRNQSDAEDAVQDAFISAFRAIDKFEGGSKLSTWLHRIAVNAALMKMRRAGRMNEVNLGELLPEFLPDGHPTKTARSFDAGPGRSMEQEETRAAVRAKIDQLPDVYRAVIMLRDIEGFDTKQTAEMLGVSEPAAKVRLHRARQALRTLLEGEFAQ